MASCAHCGRIILFGGVKLETMRFCNQGCYDAAMNVLIDIPEDLLQEPVTTIHQGDCPYCVGPGPIDIHFSYRVMSFFVLTRYETIPKIACRSCAAKSKIGNFLTTFALGWWGVPFGLVLTPIYLIRNIYSLLFPPSPDYPSDNLVEYVRRRVEQQAIQNAQEKQQTNQTF
ncbi:MAG: hypothetical protein LBT05_12810 [Planctomycetaceae bacterium]|jgi:hypothetical protein|nr:hypothetical protein [Planctomycetaceae bacterium]